ncbi:sulfotransferase [Streptomyces sp. NBC_00078]|uniref:sulfotransferase n=1 Tax=unclassified Streptomyces TaxID=2593676 RepID=UPI002258C1CF|nr:sulfotransferase [Streptomyces sp. NBC_00078]MCX5418124.1 sulfotransferase [Streptomyces sp. NBC_00078]MCX5426070.1 sulfotransferase [Streptomyces sp. NBC_00078]MCX5426161.1 sulfotransferase [Streptomyces sp. NBC_00078]
MTASPAPVVLLGAQRSGTTALADVLDQAFAAAGGVFTVNGKLPYLLHRWCTQADVQGRHLRTDEILHALHRRPPYGRHSEQWLGTVEKVLRAAAAEVAAGRVTDASALRGRLVRQAYAGTTRYGDKYNEYLLELDQLADTLPEAHWVLLIRHPAAVARSMLRWTGDRPWRPGTRRDALEKWAAWHRPWLAHPTTRDPARRTVLEYTRVCAGEDLHRLSEAIGLDLLPHAGQLAERTGALDDEPLPAHIDRLWRTLLDLRTPQPMPQGRTR